MLKHFKLGRGGRRIQSRRGFTLVEMLVAVVSGLIILAAFVAVSLNLSTMMGEVGNYTDLDKSSRQTLDMLSRDIRNAAAVSSTSTITSLQLTNTFSGTTLITYSYDGSSVFTRTLNGGTPRVLLTNCNYLAFSYYLRVPTNNLQFVSVAGSISTNHIKLVSVSWRCSRSILGSKINTESVQTADVVMRN